MAATVPEDDDPTKSADFWQQMTVKQKFNYLRRNITVEPLLACFVMPSMLTNLGTQNLFLEKACRVNLAFNETVCDALTARDTANYTAEEEQVQRLVAEMAGYRAAIQSALPCLLILFWGSWSDRHRRRKPCMMIPLIGEMLSSLGLILCVYNDTWSLGMTVFMEVIFPGMTGGWFTLMMGMYSYMADITREEERTFRIGVLTLCYQVGVPIGLSVSGILLKEIGFYGVFSLSIMFYIVAFFYGTFRLKESPALPHQKTQEMETKSFLADFFDLQHIKDTFRVAFKHGAKDRRVKVIMLMAVVMIVIGPYHGEGAVFYLFTRYRFNWSEIEYSIFSTYSVIINTAGTMISVVILSGHFQLDDALIGVFSTTSKILSSIVYGLAVSQWHMYFGSIIDIINGTSLIAMRSIASKLVTADELGKVNSLFGVAESLVPLVYAPLYAHIYTETLSILPGTFFLVGGAMTVPALVIFAWFYKQSRKQAATKRPTDDKTVSGMMTSIEVHEMIPQQRLRLSSIAMDMDVVSHVKI